MNSIELVDRRTALKGLGAAALGGCVLAAGSLASCSPRRAGRRNANDWQAWLQVDTTGRIRIYCPRVEMGQGVLTALGMLVADELDADWRTVTVEPVPLDRIYGGQITQDSSSVRENHAMLRHLGAAARVQLVAAAADLWQVPANTCVTQTSLVRHPASGRQAGYAELAERAARLPFSGTVALKKPVNQGLVGRPTARLDVPDIVAGRRLYTGDITLPGMLHATVTHSPRLGGRVESFDASAARRVAGVVDVLNLGDAIAVVGRDTWAALQGRQQLQIRWRSPVQAALDDDEAKRRLRSACASPGIVAFARGDTTSPGGIVVAEANAEYTLPYDAHATMEPAVCVAHVRDHACEIWAPTQSPWSVYRQGLDHGLSAVDRYLERIALKFTGRPRRILVHSMPLGGGFGRRLEPDQVREAVRISRVMRAPVKLQWTREEDIANDFFRPISVHQIRATLGSDGRIRTWKNRVAGAGPLGHATDFPYDCANVRVEASNHELGVPTGPWRSTGHTPGAFARECFIDELATRAGQDPLKFRLEHLTGAPRLRRVLEFAGGQAGWHIPIPPGRGRGVALHQLKDTCVAQVAEVSVSDGRIRVHRIVCAVDCGQVINPEGVRAQIEGAIVFGLTATLRSAITIKAGRIEQGNFHDFQLLRLGETPEIAVHILPSEEPPGGVGEPGVPPVAPAVANAVFAVTGTRLRDLPLRI